MAEAAGVQGYEVLVGDQQWRRTSQTEIYNRLGRKPTPIPDHLTRVLYIPTHKSADIHLPIYDVTQKFTQAVGDAQLGVSLFTTRLCMMKKPAGDGTDGDVQYLVDLKSSNGGDSETVMTATVQKRELRGTTPTATLLLPASSEDFSIEVESSNPFNKEVSVAVSHPDLASASATPLPPTPYCTFSFASAAKDYEWQIHPAEHGAMRYTLYATNKDSATMDSEMTRVADTGRNNILAIYHHLGLGTSLAMPYSEGVLLLPEDSQGQDPPLELATVTTLLGLLWRVRALDPKQRRASKSSSKAGDGKEKKSLFKRAFSKAS